MATPRVMQLIRKQLRGILTVREKEELEAWLQEAPDNGVFMETRMQPDRISQGASEILEKNDRNVRQKFERLCDEPAFHILPYEGRIFIRIAIKAAAILLPVILVWYFFSPGKKEQLSENVVAAAVRLRDMYRDSMRNLIVLPGGDTTAFDKLPNGTVYRGAKFRFSKTTGGDILFDHNSSVSGTITVSAAYGRLCRIILPEGRDVYLAPGATLAVLMEKGDVRELGLDGLAFFQVAHNAASPLVVSTRQGRVEGLGTAFNLKDYSDERAFDCTLINGAVKVSCNAMNAILKPGEEARIDGMESPCLRIFDHADTTDRLAWRRPYFDLNDLSIPQVLEQVMRWYGIKRVKYDNKIDTTIRGALGGGHIGKDFTLKELLDRLSDMNGLSFEIRGRTISVSARCVDVTPKF